MWVSLINGLVEDLKRTEGNKIRGKSSCPTIELRHQLFPAFGLWLKNVLLLSLESLPASDWLSWSSGLWIWAETTPSALLGLQLWIHGLLSLQIMWSNFWSQVLHICIYKWFCFSEEPLPIGMTQGPSWPFSVYLSCPLPAQEIAPNSLETAALPDTLYLLDPLALGLLSPEAEPSVLFMSFSLYK